MQGLDGMYPRDVSGQVRVAKCCLHVGVYACRDGGGKLFPAGRNGGKVCTTIRYTIRLSKANLKLWRYNRVAFHALKHELKRRTGTRKNNTQTLRQVPFKACRMMSPFALGGIRVTSPSFLNDRDGRVDARSTHHGKG